MIKYRLVFSRKNIDNDKGFLAQVNYLRGMLRKNFCDYLNSKNIKISFGPALPFGYESESEYVDLYLGQRLKDEEIIYVIEKNISPQFSLIRFKTIPIHFPSVESLVDFIEYEIIYKENFSKKILINFNQDNAFTSDMIYDVKIKDGIVDVILKKFTKLELFIKYFLTEINPVKIVRKNLYWMDPEKNLRVI